MLESIQKHHLVQILMFIWVSVCTNTCVHPELLSCPASVAGGRAWDTASWSTRRIADVQWTESYLCHKYQITANILFFLQCPWYDGQYYISTISATLNLDPAVIMSNKGTTWAVVALMMFLLSSHLLIFSVLHSLRQSPRIHQTARKGREWMERGIPRLAP